MLSNMRYPVTRTAAYGHCREVREGPLLWRATGGNGSSTVERSATTNGGIASRLGRSRIGDRCALLSGRSATAHQWARSATSGHTRTAARFPVTGHSMIGAPIRTNRKLRRSGVCVDAEAVTACGARSRVRRGRPRKVRAWHIAAARQKHETNATNTASR
jgi:hypothetical protein